MTMKKSYSAPQSAMIQSRIRASILAGSGESFKPTGDITQNGSAATITGSGDLGILEGGADARKRSSLD